ncbi:mitochondrial inner membrane protein OXA1L-like [Arctopsyche grandis]|uniref:mitochondrial inner membrane protein OXA1L-like n=1 Tax=Arctopsyche grandis TaxID=121162 RepID=UPI00406D650F
MYAVRLRAFARPLQLWRGAASPKGGFRALSSAAATASLPEPPAIPVRLREAVVEALPELTGPLPLEPAFSSMGLGGYSPLGIVQSTFEWLHMELGMPWWATIIAGTISVRVLLTPIVIMTQRNNAHMQNNTPTMTRIQREMTDAKQRGDQVQCARSAHELSAFMKERNIKPIRNALTPMVQFPFFISFFLGLRGMANYPVESMSHGGLFWFTDLTVPDQYYLLPIMTSLTMWATIEIGADSAKLASQNMVMLKYAFRAIPIVMLPFTVHFPGAILLYWVSTNSISLLQVTLLKTTKIRDMLNIPRAIKHDVEVTGPKKGFITNAKETWSNLKTTKEVENRQRTDEMSFNKAGKGPLVKTFRFDPTRVISAKKAQ